MKKLQKKVAMKKSNGIKPVVSRSKFIIKVDDGFCEWEYGFSLKKPSCINDYIKAIEKNMKTQRDYGKLIKSAG